MRAHACVCVCGICVCVCTQLSEVRPCLDTLHALLSQRPYKGDDEEECDHPMSERADEMSERAQGQGVEGGGTHMAVRGQGLYTLDDMLVRIQVWACS